MSPGEVLDLRPRVVDPSPPHERSTDVASLSWDELDDRAVDTARILAADAVEKVGNGHPGTAMSLAPLAYLLFQKVMRRDPKDNSACDDLTDGEFVCVCRRLGARAVATGRARISGTVTGPHGAHPPGG